MLRSTGSTLHFHPDFLVLELNSDHRSRRPWSHRRITSLALAVALSTPACGPRLNDGDGGTALLFERSVDFQADNLTTDILSVPFGLGLATLDHGWQRVEVADPEDAWLAVAGGLGRLNFFSADGDLEEIELELSLGPASEGKRQPVQVFLNGNRLVRLHPDAEWTSFTVPVPTTQVRRGFNILELAPRSGKRLEKRASDTEIRLRSLRFRSRSGRPVWPERPQTLETDDGIAMPVSSYLDLVLEIPENSTILGSYEFEATDPQPRPAVAYIQLLDGSGSERTLLNKRFLKTHPRPQALRLDLSRWAGEVVRLRVGTTGAGNGILRWRDLRVTASGTMQTPTPLPPISRSNPDRSGSLGHPDVLVVLLDAARADAFSPFGGAHPTPATERLATDGTVFEQALAAAPWTNQSVPSILTGLFPDTLRVGAWGSRLPKAVPTLAELMAAAGYRTVLWSQHPFYTNHKGLQRGFQAVHRGMKGDYQSLPDSKILIEADRPTFAFVHLIPPHAPYRPPAPFLGAYSQWYSGSFSVDADNLNSYSRHGRSADLTSEDRRFAFDRYLENVAFADDLLGRLLAILDEADRYDDSLIILLSDHGEAFMEHGQFLHTRSLHTEMLHVPLVIKWPGRQGAFAARFPAPVSLVDVVPTLVDALGLVGATEGFQGRSLLGGVFDGASERRTLYAITRAAEDSKKPPRPQLMLQSTPWRVLYNPLLDSSLLYDYESDPGERQDLSAQRPLQTLLLRQSLLSQHHWNRQISGEPDGQGAVEELDPDVVEQLEALGYLN